MGMVKLFGDMTYEGGGSINGPFLGTLGANLVPSQGFTPPTVGR